MKIFLLRAAGLWPRAAGALAFGASHSVCNPLPNDAALLARDANALALHRPLPAAPALAQNMIAFPPAGAPLAAAHAARRSVAPLPVFGASVSALAAAQAARQSRAPTPRGAGGAAASASGMARQLATAAAAAVLPMAPIGGDAKATKKAKAVAESAFDRFLASTGG